MNDEEIKREINSLDKDEKAIAYALTEKGSDSDKKYNIAALLIEYYLNSLTVKQKEAVTCLVKKSHPDLVTN